MYEGLDCPAMRRTLNSFVTDFTKMVEPDFRLGGDFKFFDGVLGYMGSSVAYPSSKDYVSKGHLQTHAVHILLTIVLFHFGVFRSWRIVTMEISVIIEGVEISIQT